MFNNADQLTTTKMTEFIERIQCEKPLIIAVCELIIIIFGLTSIFHASMDWTGYING